MRHDVICKYTDCIIYACFGPADAPEPLFCDKHALPEHVNLIINRCQFPHCFISACFGESGKSPVRCKAHKLEGHINLSKNRCPVCGIHASYGDRKEKVNGTIVRYCSIHKKPHHYNLNKHICESSGCTYVANCGFAGQKRVLCLKHKQPGMINMNCRRILAVKRRMMAEYNSRNYPTNSNRHRRIFINEAMKDTKILQSHLEILQNKKIRRRGDYAKMQKISEAMETVEELNKSQMDINSKIDMEKFNRLMLGAQISLTASATPTPPTTPSTTPANDTHNIT